MKIYTLEVTAADVAPDKKTYWRLVGVYDRESDAVYDWTHTYASSYYDYVIEVWDIE